MSRRLTTEEFIEKSRKIHGGKYDYSLVDYKNNRTKVTIICPIHGEFKQTPSDHLRGCGCSECSGTKKKNTETFIQEAKVIHGDRYDYSLVDYKNVKTKVEIICKIHGKFKQRPKDHLEGAGCPECSGTKKKNTETFIQEAKALYGDFYDYSRVDYKNNCTKVELVCNNCGYAFQTIPNSFLSARGCPYCAYAKHCNNKPAHLYYISINNGEFYKIGVTVKPLKWRFGGYDLDYKVLLWEEYKRPQDARYKEQQILEKFDEFRYRGKKRILKGGGDSELFTIDVLNLDKENE
jgi:hypothetical protein